MDTGSKRVYLADGIQTSAELNAKAEAPGDITL